jgi:hypothetical protein
MTNLKTGIAKNSGSFTGAVSEIRYFVTVGQPVTEQAPGDFAEADAWLELETEPDVAAEPRPLKRRSK